MAAATGQADVPAAGGRGRRVSADRRRAAEQGELASPRRLVDFVLRARTFGIVVVLGVVVLISALIQSRFLGGGEIRFILSQTSLYALVAVGEAMVILTRNVDLSVGSVVGLSAYVSANVFAAHPGIAITARLPRRAGRRPGLRRRHRRDHRDRARAEPRRDARDALHHPRRRHDHRRLRRRCSPAPSRPRSSTSRRERCSGFPTSRWRSPSWSAIAAYYLHSLPIRPRSLRDRLRSRRRAARRHPDRQAGLHGLRDQRRAAPASPA